MGRVILVDDDVDVRFAYGQALELAGHDVVACRALIEAIDHLSRGFDGVVVTDVRMPGRDGFDMLARVREVDDGVPVIVITGHGDVPMAVQAMRAGAFDFLQKPCSGDELSASVAAALVERGKRLAERAARAREDIRDAASPGTLHLADALAEVERQLITAALTRAEGHATAAAQALGLPRKTFYDKLKRYGLNAADYRSS